MAGLFDGEGWFSIRRVRGAPGITVREWRFQAYGHLTIREKWLLDRMVESLGAGHVAETIRPIINPKHSRYYQASWSGKALPALIKAIGSRLILKRRSAEIAWDMADMKRRNGSLPISDEFYDAQVILFEKMRLENLKGQDRTLEKKK